MWDDEDKNIYVYIPTHMILAGLVLSQVTSMKNITKFKLAQIEHKIPI